eukprot:360457-Chlamydomonas_euryale.AAC.8
MDLSSLKSVRSFAKEFNARGLPLHLLVCNAGGCVLRALLKLWTRMLRSEHSACGSLLCPVWIQRVAVVVPRRTWTSQAFQPWLLPPRDQRLHQQRTAVEQGHVQLTMHVHTNPLSHLMVSSAPCQSKNAEQGHMQLA